MGGRRLRRPMEIKKTPRAAPVASVRPDSRVWTMALEIAAGDVARIEVISSTEVIIHNRRRR